jgi:hypothetical protein
LDGIVQDKEASYISVPITTGKRFLEWRRGVGSALTPSDEHYKREHALNVIQPNQADVRPILESIRERLRRKKQDGVIIDPTTLNVSVWSQDHYHTFWTTVISRYVSTVVFVDGWEYSSGCTKEFLAAINSGADLLREDLSPLKLTEGERLVGDAIRELDDDILPKAPLEEALREIHRIVESTRHRAELP